MAGCWDIESSLRISWKKVLFYFSTQDQMIDLDVIFIPDVAGFFIPAISESCRNVLDLHAFYSEFLCLNTRVM